MKVYFDDFYSYYPKVMAVCIVSIKIVIFSICLFPKIDIQPSSVVNLKAIDDFLSSFLLYFIDHVFLDYSNLFIDSIWFRIILN